MSTAGPNSPSTAADDSTTGTIAWSNPGNVTASDNTYATAGMAGSQISHYLTAAGFGFSLPSDATVQGILVEWERKLGSGTDCRDNAVRIIKGAVIGSTDRSAGGNWPGSEAYASYGGSSDLWGLTWTAADVNASNFGAALSATTTSGGQAAVDHVRITITYAYDGQLFPYPPMQQQQSRCGRIEVVSYGQQQGEQ
jgi:hypothetical protein